MPSFRTLGNKFFGNTIGTAAGVAAGTSTSRALDPILQQLANDTWELNAVVPPDAYAMAEGVAQGQVTKASAYKWAAQQGIGQAQMDALVNVANVGPALGYAYEAWRRGFLTDTEFATALKRTGLEDQWFAAMQKLKTRLLDPADLARGIHKGLIPDPGLLAVPAPQGTGKVNAYPVYPIDALAAAEGFGYTKDDLGVLVGLQGNPMGAHEAAQAVFRGVIEPVDYDRAIAEGNTRNEWGPAIFEQSRQIPTAHDAVENVIRGYNPRTWLDQQTARHGMSAADTEVLFQNAGRPLVVHQITTALARGAKFNPEPGELTDPYEASVHESNIKPSYYEMAIANKYSYPSLFQLNALVKASAITPDVAKDWAQKDGLAPEVVDALYTFWQGEAGKSGAGASPGGKSYTYSQIHQAWKAQVFTDAQAISELQTLGYSQAKATTLLSTWKGTPENPFTPTPPAP